MPGCFQTFSLVLHTWTQNLQRHIHLHAVMACGVLGKNGQWRFLDALVAMVAARGQRKSGHNPIK
jgi:hypothetical protein